MFTSNRLILSLVFLLSFVLVKAQSNMLNASSPEEIIELDEKQKALDDSKPLPYGFIDKRDIMWSRIVWEKID